MLGRFGSPLKAFAVAFLTLASTFLATSTQAQWSDSGYYMVVFGSQGSPNLARNSHTYATFVRVDGGRVVAEDTISWLPAPGHFGPNYTMPPLAIVPGTNYDLDSTLAMNRNNRTMYWGPYQVTPDFYQHAIERVRFLSRHQTSYKMFILARDNLRESARYNRPGGAINCIMGVSDLGGHLETGTNWGFAASQQVTGHLSRYIYGHPHAAHSEVAELMSLPRRIRGR